MGVLDSIREGYQKGKKERKEITDLADQVDSLDEGLQLMQSGETPEESSARQQETARAIAEERKQETDKLLSKLFSQGSTRLEDSRARIQAEYDALVEEITDDPHPAKIREAGRLSAQLEAMGEDREA